MTHTLVTPTHQHRIIQPQEIVVDPDTGEIVATPTLSPVYVALNQALYYLLSITETLLILRFLLRLFAANPAARFTQIIYSLSAPLMQPFANLFPSTSNNGYVFDTSIVIAMLAYYLLALILDHFLRIIFTHPAT